MKILWLALACVIHTVSTAQTFYRHGKGTGKDYQCACYDDNGRLYAGHTTVKNDSFIFDRWDSATNLWTEGVRSLPTWEEHDENFENRYQCESLNDTIYLGVKRVNYFDFPRVYMVAGSDSRKIATTQDTANKPADFRLMKLNGRILLIGDFDRINGIKTGQLAYFTNDTWISAKDPMPARWGNVIGNYAARNDTAFIISAYFGTVYRWVFPDQWTIMQFNRPVEKVFSIGNNWVFAKSYLTDSLFYLVNGNLAGKKISRAIEVHKSVETKGGVILYNEQSNYYPRQKDDIFHFNPVSGEVKPFYQNPVGYEISLAASATRCHVLSRHRIVYGSENLGTLAGIRLDSIKAYAFDTIGIKVFWDKDKNGIYSPGDQYPTGKLEVLNVKAGTVLKYLNGAYIKDYIPDYMDAEYEPLKHEFGSCVFKGFSGGLKAGNTKPGITRVELEFPLQGISKQDLSVNSASRVQERLNGLGNVSFNVFNKNCFSSGNVACSLVVVLHKGIVLQNTMPAYSAKKGDTIFFDNLSIQGGSYHYVMLNVNYPLSVFKLGQTVSHEAYLTGVTEDNLDNNRVIIEQRLVYSYDPNAKQSAPSGAIKYSPGLIRYHIQFQNEGNDKAFTVKIRDTLDSRLDPFTFQMLNASHPYSVAIQGNILIWTFDKINLEAKSVNEEASMGFLVFTIEMNQELKTWDSIGNKAFIYFDDNAPIHTGMANIRRVSLLPPLNLKAGFDESISCRTMAFKNTSKNAEGFLWDFGDGETSAINEPVHNYKRNGNYPLSLVAWGFDSSLSRTVYDTISKTIGIQCTICDTLEKFTYMKDTIDCRKVYFHNSVNADSLNSKWIFRHNSTYYNYYANDPVMVFPDTGHFVVSQAVRYYSKSYYNTCIDTVTMGIDIRCAPVSGLRDIAVTRRLLCYPNPVREHLKIDNLHSDSQLIHIYDMRGMEIGFMDIEGLGTVYISTAAWAAGIYIVSGSSGEVTRLLVVR